MPNKILLTLDGSEVSEVALPYAREFARQFNLELAIVGVFPDKESSLVRIFKKYLIDIANNLKNENLKAEPVFLFGKAADEILNYTKKENFALQIMATLGRSMSGNWLIGSVAEKILKSTSVPLLLIPPKPQNVNTQNQMTFNKILVPLDGSEAGAAALPLAKNLARKTNAQLILLYVISYKVTGSLDFNVHFQEQLISMLRQQAKEYLNSVADELKKENINCRQEIIRGEVSPTILNYARNNSVDFIVLSTAGRHDMGVFAIGSTPDKVIHTTQIPVLLVRPKKRKDAAHSEL
jgi:nucleotide-binding universal stress UspA family protein